MYEIKPLEWKQETDLGEWYTAEVPHGYYEVMMTGHRGWTWRTTGKPREECASLEAGKSACEEHWRGRLAACLVDRSAEVAAALEPFQRFIRQYNKYAGPNGLRRGLADEIYGVDGGDGTTEGASIHISQIRALLDALEAK